MARSGELVYKSFKTKQVAPFQPTESLLKDRLRKGDSLILYSDGVTESIDSERNMLGESGIAEFLHENTNKSTLELRELFLEKLSHYTNKDDITFMFIKKL
ncbi:MAG: SpoIIE family protein phosphatase [Spirochaetota bacterium]